MLYLSEGQDLDSVELMGAFPLEQKRKANQFFTCYEPRAPQKTPAKQNTAHPKYCTHSPLLHW